jgi:hypothetical protein
MADAPHCGHTTPAETGGGTAGYDGSVAALGEVFTEISAAPHWSQKRAESGLSMPHCGQ